jgi:hypothetical protein
MFAFDFLRTGFSTTAVEESKTVVKGKVHPKIGHEGPAGE